MPPCTIWGAIAVAAALVTGSAAAQLVPQAHLPEVPVTAPPVASAPRLTLPAPLRPKALQSVSSRILSNRPTVTPGTLLGSGTLPLPDSLLRTDVAIPTLSTSLPQTSPLLRGALAPPGAWTLQLKTFGQAGFSTATAATLEAARKRRLDDLLREEAAFLESDDHGNPVVRGKLLLLEPDKSLLDRLRTRGYRIISDRVEAHLQIRMVELAVPRGLSATEALRRVRSIAPDADADYDHVYEPAGGALAPARAPVAKGKRQGRLLIGMVDGGVARHPSLGGTSIEQKGFAGALRPTEHGTAVASLLAGNHSPFRGAAQGASLAVADVYGGRRSAGSASAIVRALGWLVSNQPAVINISLVGPPNRLLGAAIRSVQARKIYVVAAVGNDGPASPPQYPASYSGVVAITGVDARGRVLVEAGNAAHIDFAAPAAEMAAARPGNGYARVRGTSFAAPLAAGRLALLGSMQKLAAEARPGKGRVGRGIVCASCRTDPARVKAN